MDFCGGVDVGGTISDMLGLGSVGPVDLISAEFEYMYKMRQKMVHASMWTLLTTLNVGMCEKNAS